MSGNFGIRTDLAVESKEKYEKDNVEIKGVAIQEKYEEALDLNTTVVRIQTEQGAKAMEKPKGTYITMEAPNLIVPDEDYHREISQALAHHLKELLHLEKEKSILVVGLGNREITPDALGPQVIQNLKITRHIIKEYGKAGMGKKKVHQISSLVPGVMAQTGMETMEIIRGVIRLPDHTTDDPGDGSGCSDRHRCTGGTQCTEIKLYDSDNGYGNQSGIWCL